jgi:hypothetical protein
LSAAILGSSGLVFIFRMIGDCPFPVSDAVGWSSYFYRGQGRLYWYYIAALLCPMFCLIVYSLHSKRNIDYSYDMKQTELSENIKKIFSHKYFLIFVFIMIAYLNLPFEILFQSHAAPESFRNTWDANNNLTWKYFIQSGILPYLDFWYPYAGNLLIITNLFFNYFIHILLFILLFISIYKLNNFDLLKSIFLFIAVYLICKIFSYPYDRTYRYLIPSMILAISYINLERYKKVFSPYNIIFALSLILNLIIEPINLISIIPAIFILLYIEFFTSTDKVRYAKNYAKSIITAVLFLLIFFIILEVMDFFIPIVKFYTELGSLSHYGNFDLNDITRIFYLAEFKEGIAFWLCGIIGAVSIYYYISTHKNKNLNKLAFILTFSGIILGYKHLVREDYSLINCMYIFIIFIILLFIINAKSIIKDSLRYMTCACIIIALLVSHDNISNYVYSVYNKILYAPKLIDIIFNQHKSVQYNKAKYNYSRQQFILFPEELELAEAIATLGISTEYLYMFGDMPVINILTRTKPIWQIDTYDTSPLHEQKKVISMLKLHKPPVIWHKKSAITMDGLPLAVRNPVLLGYIVSHYQPAHHSGNYTILMPLSEGEDPDIEFWSEQLSTQIDLKYIPRLSNIYKLPITNKDTLNAVYTANITINPNTVSRDNSIQFTCIIGKQKFTVLFNVDPDQHEYGIILDRLWFIEAARHSKYDSIQYIWPDNIDVELLWRDNGKNMLY